jgi:hypothetical protein
MRSCECCASRSSACVIAQPCALSSTARWIVSRASWSGVTGRTPSCSSSSQISVHTSPIYKKTLLQLQADFSVTEFVPVDIDSRLESTTITGIFEENSLTNMHVHTRASHTCNSGFTIFDLCTSWHLWLPRNRSYLEWYPYWYSLQ